MSNKKQKKIQILSFFSGGGFMDLGFEEAGFEIIWSNELDKDFAALHSAGVTSYRKSKGNGKHAEIFNTNSINDVSAEQISLEAFPDGKPAHFGIIGGPPCQDFSLNGKQKGFKGNRGQLTVTYLERIKALQPDFFVLENVTGLFRIKSNKEYFFNLLKDIQKDYITDDAILNSLSFGVPQSRERVFVVGFKKSLPVMNNQEQDYFKFPFFETFRNDKVLKRYQWPMAEDFGGNPKKNEKIPEELCVESCLVADVDLRSIPNADEFFPFKVSEDKLNSIKEGETNRPSFKRLHRFRYSPTACYGNNEVHLHPYKNRRISVREALRIQGVPDEYILPKTVSMTKKFKLIGNGVPVPMAQAVAEAIKKFLT